MDNMFQLSIELYDTLEKNVLWSDHWYENWDNLSSIKDYLFQFNTKLKVNKITPIQACLSFIHSIKEIDKIIVGANSLKEFKEILKNNKKKDLNANFYNQFKLNDSNILNPVNW